MEEFEDSTKKVGKGNVFSNQAAPVAPPAPVPFDLNTLRSKTDLADIQQYAASSLPEIGKDKGQGRAVFRIDEVQVLKVAKNPGGIGQNQAESNVCAGSGNHFDLFPKVIESHKGGLWLITQYSPEVSKGEFEQLTGIPWIKFESALAGAFVEKLDQSKQTSTRTTQNQQSYLELSTNEFFSKIIRIIQDCKYEPGDLAKIDSWGKLNNRAVIIDSGFTEAVNQAHYKK